jgi:hypothetical protein
VGARRADAADERGGEGDEEEEKFGWAPALP